MEEKMKSGNHSLPVIIDDNIRDRVGSALLELLFSHEMIFVPHSGSVDFGIDFNCELTSENETTGEFFNIQLKSHQKMEFNGRGNFYQTVKVSTARYWLTMNMPVILVLVDLSTLKIYGIDAQKFIRQSIGPDRLGNEQDTVTFDINQNDIFSFQTCIKAFTEYDRYKLLLSSSCDAIVIKDLLIYINEYTGRDQCMTVEVTEDYTNEILSLAEKYSHAFADHHDLISLKVKMESSISECYDTNAKIIYYDDYSELLRTKFNYNAYNYLSFLIDLICDEIEKDKIGRVKNACINFKKLQTLIKDFGKPIGNDKWYELSDKNFFNKK